MPKLKSYIIGFISSVILILAAFALVQIHVSSHHERLSHGFIIGAIITLAFIQMVFQLRYFLHLGDKTQRWNLAFLVSTIGIVLIIVAGSLWIMEKLNFNMSSKQMMEYMKDQGSY